MESDSYHAVEFKLARDVVGQRTRFVLVVLHSRARHRVVLRRIFQSDGAALLRKVVLLLKLAVIQAHDENWPDA